VRGGEKENGGGGEFKYDIRYTVIISVSITTCPHPAQQKKEIQCENQNKLTF
jgi:hypothetical protein